MDSRRAWVVSGLLALCCVGLLFSVVYPVGSATPHADTPSDEQFWSAETAPYSMTGAVVVDGDRQFGFEDRATTSGERYQRVEESETTTERYQAAPNATRYERLRMDSEANVDRMRDQIERDERQELLEAHRTEEHVTFIIATNGSDPTVDFADPAAVVVRSLHAVGYEPTGDASPDRIRYEPQAGWYGDTDGYRITNANGDIRVDASANTVESASVSWDVTEPADSYAQYVATSLSSSDPTTHEISFELQRDQPEVTQPSWSPDT